MTHVVATSTALQRNTYYYMFYTIGLNFLLMGFIPYLLLIVLTVAILKAIISHAKERRQMFSLENGDEDGASALHHQSSVTRHIRQKSIFDFVDPQR